MSDIGTPEQGAADSGKAKKPAAKRPNIFARMALFLRQVISELRKVIWPTRKELITYTGVVIVFVAVIATIVALLDFGFTRAVLAVFG